MSELCQGCGLPNSAPELDYHPACTPEHEKLPGTAMSLFEMTVREDLIEIIKWASDNSARSRQMELGCSEAGEPCDRRLSYRIAGTTAINHGMDPWPAIVGTSIHTWMESAVNAFQDAHGFERWHTELSVIPNPLVRGHSDLYDAHSEMVLDYKFPGDTNIRKLRKEGIPENYLTQIQLYGLGHERAGRRVSRVGLVALGRSGWLKDMLVLTVPYDKAHAERALQRVFALGEYLLQHDLDDPKSWEGIRATPSRLCAWCPMYRPGRAADIGGCPGSKNSMSADDFFN